MESRRSLNAGIDRVRFIVLPAVARAVAPRIGCVLSSFQVGVKRLEGA